MVENLTNHESDTPKSQNLLDLKPINFFEYKRYITWLIDQYRENEWFIDQNQMKEFLYNEDQENPDGIIMEINTVNVWWPWIIEVIEWADVSFIKTFPNSPYSKFLQELNFVTTVENEIDYFEKYILSELKDKNAEKILLLFHKNREGVVHTVENIWLKKEYAEYVSLDQLHKIIKENKGQLEKTLLMNYGFLQTHQQHKHHEVFQEVFQDRYLNQENVVFSCKQRPTILWREDLTWSYLNKEKLDENYDTDILANKTLAKNIEQSYVMKEAFTDQWSGIHFPEERTFMSWNIIKVKGKEIPAPEYYALQRFHELPRKISLEAWWEIAAKTVDIRAYMTFDVDKKDVDIQIFGREGNIGSVNNVSNGWKFTKVYIVEDDVYYDMQSKLHTLILDLWIPQNNTIEKYFDDYANKGFKIIPGSRISHIPFIMARSWLERIQNLVGKFVENMIKTWFISKNNKGQVIGNTVIGIDMSINPLPKEIE